ncbi:MAG: TIGR03905 family TSCPD domain-containing protein [Clostridia bacterium]|nr:TIGR03905 family TSCPD domain-containing protein [Clostridia bacterium]
MVHYRNFGTCSESIDLEIRDGVIAECRINGGCRGNTQGLSKMVIGRNAEEVRDLLRGIQCRNGTSCPDQLSRAIDECLRA